MLRKLFQRLFGRPKPGLAYVPIRPIPQARATPRGRGFAMSQ